MTATSAVLPGSILGKITDSRLGSGTYINDGSIIACILGEPLSNKLSKYADSSSSVTASKSSDQKQSSILSVLRPSSASSSLPLLPSVGAQVYAKIVAVQRQQALCEIRVICPPDRSAIPSLNASNRNTAATSNEARITEQTQTQTHMHPLTTPFRGILRAQDVRATEKDKIKLSECFRVGDVVRAVVISLGDQGGYYLSTAGNEYGVILAWSQGAGNLCVPVSWCEVVDSVTGDREMRKVAKPI